MKCAQPVIVSLLLYCLTVTATPSWCSVCLTHGDPLVPAAPRSWCPPLSCFCCVRGALWGNCCCDIKIKLSWMLVCPMRTEKNKDIYSDLTPLSTYSCWTTISVGILSISLGAERILRCFLNIKAVRSCEKYWRIINKRIHIRSHSEWLPFLTCINGNLFWQLSCCFPSSWTQSVWTTNNNKEV